MTKRTPHRHRTPPTWQIVLRTTLRMIIAFAAAAPLLYTAITRDEPEAAVGGAAMLLAVAGSLTRLMGVPAVDRLLRTSAPWLVSEAPCPGGQDRPGRQDCMDPRCAEPVPGGEIPDETGGTPLELP